MEKVKETTATLFNKILIPVITTVLGATAIYFLGFNKKGGRSEVEAMLFTKEQTVKAWKSFVTSQNIAHKNTNSISEEYGQRMVTAAETSDAEWLRTMEDFEDEMLREAEKTKKDLESILKDEKDIDKDFASMLNRALDNHLDQVKKARGLFDRLKNIIKSDIPKAEKQQQWGQEAQKVASMGEKMEERSATEAEAISKILTERYNLPFDLKELLVYMEYKNKKNGVQSNEEFNTGPNVERPPADPLANPDETQPEVEAQKSGPQLTADYLSGEWKMKGGTLQLDASGAMYWVFDGKGYTSGSWKIAQQTLHMDAINPDTKVKSLLVCSVTKREKNSFTLTILGSTEMYQFTRVR